MTKTPEFKDFDQIVSDMMTTLQAKGTKITDMNPGSIIRTLFEVFAYELDQGYYTADQILKLFFAITTSGQYLDKRAGEKGLTRAAGAKATGVITGSRTTAAPFSQLIPAGTTWETEDKSVQLVCTADTTLTQGSMSVDVPVDAAAVGASGNLQTGLELKQVGVAVSLVEAWAVKSPGLAGGTNEEGDDSLRARYLAQLRLPATSGNIYHYKQWALQVTGIGDAKVFPLWSGNGTVKVAIVDTEKQPASPELVTQTAAYIETMRPIGATVTVVAATGKQIAITATVVLAEGVTLDSAEDAFIDAILDYYEKVAFQTAYASYAKIGALLLDTPGVMDYSDLEVNGDTANVSLAEDEVPVNGSITLEA